MGKKILVIGGTRFFGRLLVRRLLDAGHDVTIATRGQAADAFGDRIRRIRVDRRDESAMRQAFSAVDGYDIIYDQMCYSPLDAAISVATFAGKVKRYVMASTIEVYNHLPEQRSRPLALPFSEDELDPSAEPVDLHCPWHVPEFAEAHYGAGKRQAEAYFHQNGSLPVVSVRIAHVLAGPEDFTGRLSHYVRQVRQNQPFYYSAGLGESSFINADGISDFLCWAGDATFSGAVNAACNGNLSALAIHRRVAAVLGKATTPVAVPATSTATELSPFDYPFPYRMSTQRAVSLGYDFIHCDAWLDGLIRQHDAALAGERESAEG